MLRRYRTDELSPDLVDARLGLSSFIACSNGGPCIPCPPCRILLGYPQADEGEGEDMNAVQVTQQGVGVDGKTQIRARITHVGS